MSEIDDSWSELTREQRIELFEGGVFELLRVRDSHEFNSQAELKDAMVLPHRVKHAELSEALQNLASDGVIELGGQRIRLSRAASRTMWLWKPDHCTGAPVPRR